MSKDAGSAGNAHFTVAVMPGDGIGPEVMAPCLELLDGLGAEHGFRLTFRILEAGADLYRRTGDALPNDVIDAADGADAILLGAMGDPAVRYPDGREIAPQVDLREHFGLFAGVRPIRTHPGMTVPLADPRGQNLDLVIVRESTEGMFAGRNDAVVTHDSAQNTMTITRAASESLFDFAFDLARQRKAQGSRGMVTCVDKANVFATFGFFRDIFDERAALNTDIETDYCYVDAMALNLVRRPWDYDVIVTENLFGDILSDLGAGLMGGMGMAPSADIGAKHAVFQPCHGTAPDIAGMGKANPTAMILSAAMMLDWLGRCHEVPACIAAGAALEAAVTAAFSGGGLQPFEVGGSHGTAEITQAVRAQLQN
ncbi:MAG: isocitrate/isopropylmalate dehydrogenase family protein [Alphaproteobacteria bacterium]